MMFSDRYLNACLLPFLVVAAQAKSSSVYSFAEGKAHPKGLEHGARGFACLKSLHGHDMEFLKEVGNNGEEVTDEHIAAAIYMAYGEKRIDTVCRLSKNLEATRRSLRTAKNKPTFPTEEAEPTSDVNTERRTQVCAGGTAASYPSKSGIYTGYVSERIQSLLPDGAGADSRLDPTKVVNDAERPLDDALEGEYDSILCGTYFNGFATLASIPDFVVFKQGPILDGINSLSCGIARSAMRSTQEKIRGLMSDGMTHNSLINRAEISATYANTKTLADALCSLGTRVSGMRSEINVAKQMITEERISEVTSGNP